MVGGLLIGRECRLYGWSLEETTGEAGAAIRLIDGGNAAASHVLTVNLDPGQTRSDWLGRPGLRIRSSLFCTVASGLVRAAIWYIGLSDDDIMAIAAAGAQDI
jgi:hypothetical protein